MGWQGLDLGPAFPQPRGILYLAPGQLPSRDGDSACPVPSANPFMSPLSCLTPLCPAPETSRLARGFLHPLNRGEKCLGPLSRLEKASGSWHAPEPPWGRGLSHSRERSRRIRTFARRLTPVIWAPLLGSRLGAAAISAGNGGCGEPRGAGGIQPSREFLAAAGEGKDLEMSSRIPQLPAQPVPGAGSAPREEFHGFSLCLQWDNGIPPRGSGSSAPRLAGAPCSAQSWS